MERYKCYLCNAEVDLPKKRIKCLVCSKMSLVPIAVLQQSGSTSSNSKKERVEKIFKENKFIDDLILLTYLYLSCMPNLKETKRAPKHVFNLMI